MAFVPSQFNTFLSSSDSRHFVFNHVTGALQQVPEDVYRCLEAGDAFGAKLRGSEALVANRVVVRSRLQELSYVTDRLEAMRTSNSVLKYTVIPTYECNLLCPYCYEDSQPIRTGRMSQDTAGKLVESIREDLEESRARQVGIALYGGEPLVDLSTCCRILDGVASICAECGAEFAASLISNGTLLRDKALDTLGRHVQMVQLTFDGGPEEHDSIRRKRNGAGTFRDVLQAARRVLRHGVRALVRIQFRPGANASVNECLKEMDTAGLLASPLLRLYFFPILNIRDVCAQRRAACCAYDYGSDRLPELWELVRARGGAIFPLPTPVWNAPYCSFVNRHAVIIDPNGFRYKCVALVGDPESATGSIFRGAPRGREPRGAQERAFASRTGAAIEQCRRCASLPTCDGGCAYLAKVAGGSIAAPECESRGRADHSRLQFVVDRMDRGREEIPA